MLNVLGIECRRGGRALFSDLTFAIHPGELLHIQGVNGSGKTSLLRILAGLSRQEVGEVRWNGADVRESREDYAASLLYLGHQPAVKDDLTVAENLSVSSRLAGLDLSPRAMSTALDIVGLGKRTGLPARVLSQGQRRRLALARLWLDRRPLWVLDEPFTALDMHATALLENRLEQHLMEGGMVVLTTHQPPVIGEEYMRVLSLSA
jgi:heme exporter protein A